MDRVPEMVMMSPSMSERSKPGNVVSMMFGVDAITRSIVTDGGESRALTAAVSSRDTLSTEILALGAESSKSLGSEIWNGRNG